MKKLLGNLYELHWEYMGLFVIAILFAPILFLCYRDGLGSAVFPVHDQLDETILNYVFPARYFGEAVYEQMMCGIPAEGLKPFCPVFVPLYRVFNVYTAFLIQYFIVICTAFYGTFFCVKDITNNRFAAFISATLFSFLPFRSIYGNVVAGTPLLILSVLKLTRKTKQHMFLPIMGLVFYALSTSFALSGWAAVATLSVIFILVSWKDKRCSAPFLITDITLLTVYVLCNCDLIGEVFLHKGFISHRVEFGFGASSVSYAEAFYKRLLNGSFTIEAISKHEFIWLPLIVCTALLLIRKGVREKYLFQFLTLVCSILALTAVCAFFSTEFVYGLKEKLPGMLRTIQLERFHYFLPGLWYILLGVALAVILKAFPARPLWHFMATIAGCVVILPLFYSIAKDEGGIFYQNVNQVNNGEEVTGYVTMQNLYAEDLMQMIEERIGKDMSSYRVGHIGICPVAALMHGFYTVDGYSNNYPLSYKNSFREVIEDELELSAYNREYFDKWGSRCYLFYHEWGNAYMLPKTFNGQISDMHFHLDKLKELNCRYIFSAGEILNCERYGLKYIDYFETKTSYFGIWLYEVE